MCHDRRITIIRAVLSVLLALTVLPFSFWTFYAITLLLFGLMMPVFAADCGTVTGACNAGTKPASASTTTIGFPDGDCGDGNPHSCLTLNGTFVTPYSSDGTASCTFTTSDLVVNCAGVAKYEHPTVTLNAGTPNVSVTFFMWCNGSTSTINWDSGSLGAHPVDCSALGSVALTFTGKNALCGVSCNPAGTSATTVFS